MKKNLMSLLLSLVCVAAMAQTQEQPKDAHIGEGLASIGEIVAESREAVESPDSTAASTKPAAPAVEIPVWKQKLYYGYNFDIYLHNDSRSDRKENGWSISVTPEIGWRVSERIHTGLRFGGGYMDGYITYMEESGDGKVKTANLRIRQGSWEVTPYGRYRLKTLFNEKVGIWLEGHLYAGMEFPRVTEGDKKGTDYDGLGHIIVYGAQISPVITYQFNRKSTLQIFFSIMSIGYSGSTFCYEDPIDGHRHNEYTNDVIIFSGKLSNLIANQFTPGLYGFKLGIQKSF